MVLSNQTITQIIAPNRTYVKGRNRTLPAKICPSVDRLPKVAICVQILPPRAELIGWRQLQLTPQEAPPDPELPFSAAPTRQNGTQTSQIRGPGRLGRATLERPKPNAVSIFFFAGGARHRLISDGRHCMCPSLGLSHLFFILFHFIYKPKPIATALGFDHPQPSWSSSTFLPLL